MKLLLKILFFVLAIFQTNICEAKVFVFAEVVTQIRFIENAIENKNEVTTNLENDIEITCKNESDLVDYRSWATSAAREAAKMEIPVMLSSSFRHSLSKHLLIIKTKNMCI